MVSHSQVHQSDKRNRLEIKASGGAENLFTHQVEDVSAEAEVWRSTFKLWHNGG